MEKLVFYLVMVAMFMMMSLMGIMMCRCGMWATVTPGKKN
jgi:hypothetical protein